MKRVLLVIAVLAGVVHAEPRPHLELPSQQLTDGEKLHLSPMHIEDSRAQRDARPLMFGGGIVVLAAIFWWSRKRRERFDRSDAPEDQDDLQAAARGPDKDEE